VDGAGAVKSVKFKLYDKRAALVDLGRHYKLFTDKIHLNVTVSLEMLVAESYKEAGGKKRTRPRSNGKSWPPSSAGSSGSAAWSPAPSAKFNE
jgi:hypothetical protein